MKGRPFVRALACISVLAALGGSIVHTPIRAAPLSAIQAPVLKWQRGGCYSSWCETGWYSSPAVADLDGDGQTEVIGSAYSIFVLDGATGALEWRVASGHDRSQPGAGNVGRTWPGIVVADVDDDGNLEIVTAHGGGYVSVYNSAGYFEPGWPQRPITQRTARPVGLRPGRRWHAGDRRHRRARQPDQHLGLRTRRHAARRLAAVEQRQRLCLGRLQRQRRRRRPGRRRHGRDRRPLGRALYLRLRAGRRPDPRQRHVRRQGLGQGGRVGKPGRPSCAAGESATACAPRATAPTLPTAPPSSPTSTATASMEVVATGNVYDCDAGYPPSRYNGVYIFNADRSRFNTGGFDWRTVPVDTGAPLSEDYNVIESAQPNPAVADLDGDGSMEILYRLLRRPRARLLAGQDRARQLALLGLQPGEGFYRFASEPVVADLDNDGQAEVIFASWTQKGSDQTGKLHILDYLGNPLHEVDLPAGLRRADWNGALAAPTLANIDGDADLEVVLNTAHSGLVAYDLPGTANARILWGTGRGNYSAQRLDSWSGRCGISTKQVRTVPGRAPATRDLHHRPAQPGPGPARTSA